MSRVLLECHDAASGRDLTQAEHAQLVAAIEDSTGMAKSLFAALDELATLRREREALRASRDDFADRHAELCKLVADELPWGGMATTHEIVRGAAAELASLRARVKELEAELRAVNALQDLRSEMLALVQRGVEAGIAAEFERAPYGMPGRVALDTAAIAARVLSEGK